MANSKLLVTIFCVSAIVLLAGCRQAGPEVAPVKGRITLDGRPLPNVVVQFQPDGGKRPSAGGTDENGDYQLFYKRGLVGGRVGQHTVSVLGSNGPGAPVLPPQYNKQSTLRAEVKPGANEINFDLKSDAK